MKSFRHLTLPVQRNHHLAQSVGDASFGMFLTLLEYKCSWYGVNLIKIDRFAPSSKTCGKCGYIYKRLKLSERSWTCPECGTHHDRNFNAACNIKDFGLKPHTGKPTCVLKSRGRKKQEKLFKTRLLFTRIKPNIESLKKDNHQLLPLLNYVFVYQQIPILHDYHFFRLTFPMLHLDSVSWLLHQA